MKPFFSPLVREKVKSLAKDYPQFNELFSYINKCCLSIDNGTEAYVTQKEEITYLVLSCLDDIAIIQSYTTPHRTHAAHLLKNIMYRAWKKIANERESDDKDKYYSIIAFHISMTLIATVYPDMKDGLSEIRTILINYKLPTFKITPKADLANLVKEYFNFVTLKGIASDVETYIIEENVIQEQEAQSKKINVVTWDALLDSLQTVDKEHLDAFHSYFTRVATKYSQDNDKLRNNLDKLTTQIEQCKEKHASIVHKTYNIDKIDQFVDTLQEQTIKK